jgi:hypothetical protein
VQGDASSGPAGKRLSLGRVRGALRFRHVDVEPFLRQREAGLGYSSRKQKENKKLQLPKSKKGPRVGTRDPRF